MLASLDLVTAANADTTSRLHGLVDGTRVAAVGHSAGGTIAFESREGFGTTMRVTLPANAFVAEDRDVPAA